METRTMGNTDLTCSPIGYGTWEMSMTDYGPIDPDEVTRAIHAAIDHGITLIDTAECYGPFNSEELLGKILGDKRKDITLVSKVGFGFAPEGYIMGLNSKPDNVIERTETCLKRLQTDVIDLQLIHWPDYETPLEETVGALEQLKKDGKIRHWGLSNHDPAMLETARKCGNLAASQVGYNLLDRRMEKEMFPYCLENNIGFMGYGTLAFGLLSGGLEPENTFEDDDWRSHMQAFGLPLLDQDRIPKELKLGERLGELAGGYGKTLPQLAIAWAIGNPAVTVSLVGMRNEKELEENVVAAEWTLTEADRAEIDRIFEEENIPTNIDVPQALTLPPSTKWG